MGVQDSEPQLRQTAQGRPARAAPEVGEATRQALSRAYSHVVKAADYTRSGRRSEVRLRLHPPELGRMKVAVEMREGRVEVRIEVENADVRDAIRRGLGNLDRALKDAQVDVNHFEVGDYHPGRGQRREGGLPTESSPCGAPGGDAVGVVSGGTERGWIRFTESGRLDCLV